MTQRRHEDFRQEPQGTAPKYGGEISLQIPIFPMIEFTYLGVLNHEGSLEFDVALVHAKAGAVKAHAPEYLQCHVKEPHVVDGSRQLRRIGVGARKELGSVASHHEIVFISVMFYG